MYRWRNAGGVAVLLVVAALAVVASAGAKRQANPIVIEVIAPVATPIENYPDAQAGVDAAAAALNKKGGIKGQQIQVKFCNTQSNANAATACARQAVSDGATFVTGYLGTQSALIIPILAAGEHPDHRRAARGATRSTGRARSTSRSRAARRATTRRSRSG